MRFGVCAPIEAAGLLAQARYDYIELAAAGDLIPDDDETAWAEKRRAIEAMPLPVEAFNSFVRAGKIVGPEADAARLRRYVNHALTRAAEVGGKIIVFGSAGARNVPDGFPREEAERQMSDFLGWCADASERTGVIVCIEPLERDESNILHLVSEGAELARRLGRQGVRNLADTWHMECESEPLDVLPATADVLAHCHTADTHRNAPGTGTYDHTAFFRALRQAGYNARLSCECSWPQEPTAFAEQLRHSLHHLKSAYSASRAV